MADNAAPARRAVLRFDVGKASRWACMLTRDGEVAANRPVASSEHELDRLFSQVGEGTLVVVDQVRNIGALPISRARGAGPDVAYPPGMAAHQASRMFAGDAKTDERDARVIARTAMGLRDALPPVPERDGNLEAARSLASQRDHMVTCATRDKNRPRPILLESRPALEALADPSDPRWPRVLARPGGARGAADAGRASLSALMRGAGGSARADAWAAIVSSTRPPEVMVRAENPQVKMLARRISEAMEEASRLDAEIASPPESDGTYARPLTIPGIGPRTASELTIAIDISSFPDHDHLASYRGIAPRKRRSGTPIASVAASRRGNKGLKNPLIFSCNPLTRSADRFGEYYRARRGRGMCHGEALKAVARKRLKVIYAVMRDRTPYAA